MKTNQPKEYIAPEVKIIEVLVEQGFAITGITNGIMLQERHIENEPMEWEW